MKKTVLILVLIIVAISCKKDDNTVSINSYPMEVGSEWTYDRQLIITKYETKKPSEKTTIDTINFVVRVWIDKDTTLNDTMPVKVFKAVENNENLTSIQYLFEDNEGLKTYAYSNAGLVVFPKKRSSWNFHFEQFNTHGRHTATGETFYESPPTLNLKIPFEENSEWTYRTPSDSNSLQIDKKVISMEMLEVNNMTFTCGKINWNHLYNDSYEGINIIDWVAEEGLIERFTTIDTITVTNELGEPLYKAYLTESLKLIELNLK